IRDRQNSIRSAISSVLGRRPCIAESYPKRTPNVRHLGAFLIAGDVLLTRVIPSDLKVGNEFSSSGPVSARIVSLPGVEVSRIHVLTQRTFRGDRHGSPGLAAQRADFIESCDTDAFRIKRGDEPIQGMERVV